MRPAKSDKVIMEKLAFFGPRTIYRLNKETGYSTSTIHAAIKRLSSKKLVKKHKKGFILSFIGVIKYFLSRFEDHQFNNVEVKKVVQNYSLVDDYLLFLLYPSFEEWLGNDFYADFLSVAYIVNHLFESKIHVVYVKAPKPIKRGEKVPIKIPASSLEEEEVQWKHKFAICFFNVIRAKPRKKVEAPMDQTIHDFIKETFEKEISIKKQDITKLESTLLALIKSRRNE